MKYQAVIFDLFGTLVKTWSPCQCDKVLFQMAEIFGAPRDQFQHLWFQSFDMLNSREYAIQERQGALVCQQLGISVTETQVKYAAELWFTFALASMTPRPEALQTLATLRARRLKIALISDYADEVPVLWGRTSLAPMIDITTFSCVVGIRKPDARIYRITTDQLGVEPQSCLYVGDGGGQELSGAQKVGMHPVLFRVPHDEKPDIPFTVEKWRSPTISTLSKVLDLVK